MALCHICHDVPALGHGRCAACNRPYMRDYMREYRKTVMPLKQRTAFKSGARAMQQSIVAQLRNLGSSDLNGFAAANAVENMEVPNVHER